jgi:hypothetical protein
VTRIGNLALGKFTREKRVEIAILDYVEGKNDFDETIKEIKLAMSNDFDEQKIKRALSACRIVLHDKPDSKNLLNCLKKMGILLSTRFQDKYLLPQICH